MTTRARREREKEERRQAILQAARKVFFQKGFHRATVDDVAELAELSKGTVYLYFESKETLLAHLLLEGLDELLERLEEVYAETPSVPADERLRKLGLAYLDFFTEQPDYFWLLMATDRGRFQETVTPEICQQVLSISLEGLDLAARAIQQGVEEGVFHCQSPRQAATILWATLNGVLELMAHPLRREIVGIERATLYREALETFIRSLQVDLTRT
ncbi:MAG: TetR/AcrR family transcriptional regulator [Anaerolineae bacterium]|nr:TetR/AcrR family transcriptional regulator [Anaerolineae bacterium]